MNRRTNIINNVLSMGLTLIALMAVILVGSEYFYVDSIEVIGYVVLGAIIAGFIVAISHEVGHLIAGRRNGFKLYCIVIWFFKWVKVGKKISFSFTIPLEEAGYTEMIPAHTDNLLKRFKKMTIGGFYGPAILMVVGIVPLALVSLIYEIPVVLFFIWAMLLPMGAYYLFGNILPMSSGEVCNDGALILSIKKGDDLSKVNQALLIYQAELYNGKTPGEIDDRLLFDLPQLPEDQPSFAMLLDARYNYFLDKEDYENAKKVIDRLLAIENLPRHISLVAKANALYNACTFDYDEDKADDLMYELEKYLNNVNNALNVRVKLAYLIYINKEFENAETFYKKGKKESNRCPMIGMGKFQIKLLDQLKKDFN